MTLKVQFGLKSKKKKKNEFNNSMENPGRKQAVENVLIFYV